MSLPDPDHDPQFYAGVPARRFAAFVIDAAVIVALTLPVMVLGAIFSILTFGLGSGLGALMAVLTGFLYRFGMLTVFGATAGMLLMGIEVRDADGRTPGEGTAFVHTAGFNVTFLFPPLLIIGWILMVQSPYRRAMHDLPLGTVVINRPV